jgi:hypothetical protein
LLNLYHVRAFDRHAAGAGAGPAWLPENRRNLFDFNTIRSIEVDCRGA